ACSPEVNVQEPVSVNQSARIEAAANLRLYAGLIAESLLDPATAPEVYQRVLLGYEGQSAIPLSFLVGGTMPDAKASKLSQKARAPLFEKQLRQKGALANQRGVVANLVQAVTEQQVELYWPYWQEWNGRELPTITFTPAESTTESIGYKPVLLKNGTIKLEQVRVDDDYAFAHPTWILRHHTTVDPRNSLKGRFLPNFMQGPRLTFVDNQLVSAVETEQGGTYQTHNEELPQPDPDGETFSPTDPGYYYSTGSSDLGPGFVPGPANGTADVNE
ncbi:hypothetical protein, partial [Spirosoma luteolum]